MKYVIHSYADPMNPRTEFDNFGTMLCAEHRRYNLGDEQTTESEQEIMTRLAREADPALARWIDRAEDTLSTAYYSNNIRHDSLEREINKKRDAWVDQAFEDNYAWLPLYLYDHGGLTMRTGPFSCPWDSGRVGMIYASKTTIVNEYGVEWTPETKAKAESLLKAEVEEYTAYLQGESYWYEILDDEGNQLDSCYGYYGRECAEEAAREALQCCLHREPKQHLLPSLAA